MLALWAEMDLALADEFRDGNVPSACEAPLECGRAGFRGAAGDGHRNGIYRGDSAC